MFSSPRKALIEFLKAVAKVLASGLLIGFLQDYQFVILGLILMKFSHIIFINVIRPSGSKNWVLVTGMLLTGFFGILAEYWGVTSHYWEYHNIPWELPVWLPFAWIMAFYILYQAEHRIVPFLSNPSARNRIGLMIILTLIIPALGEMVAINMGVWSYYWPYQFLGVPVYAFIALVLIHMLVYFILYLLFQNSYGKMLPFSPTSSSPQ